MVVPTLMVFACGIARAQPPNVADRAPRELSVSTTAQGNKLVVFSSTLGLTNPAAIDQDDVCFWRHPRDSSLNRIIASDKSANHLFVYTIDGAVTQSLDVAKPGNIDLRTGFRLNGRERAIVAVGSRAENRLHVYVIDDDQRLRRVDDGNIATHAVYGGGLLAMQCAGDREFYFFASSKTDGVQQWRLDDNGRGQVSGQLIRSWPFTICEGVAGDDKTGDVFVCAETEGVYRIQGDPKGKQAVELVIKVGEHEFLGDAEGIALLHSEHADYIVVSDQGSSRFQVYRQQTGFPFVGRFAIEHAEATDGFDLCRDPFGPKYSAGILVCHSDADDGKTLRVADVGQLVSWIRDRP